MKVMDRNCFWCDKPLNKYVKYCNEKCAKKYRRYGVGEEERNKIDIVRRLKKCEMCNNLFYDNTSNLNRLHCSISCQNMKYYYKDRANQIQRAKEYRMLYPEKNKKSSRPSNLNRDPEKHKEYMKIWHNKRKEIENK